MARAVLSEGSPLQEVPFQQRHERSQATRLGKIGGAAVPRRGPLAVWCGGGSSLRGAGSGPQ